MKRVYTLAIRISKYHFKNTKGNEFSIDSHGITCKKNSKLTHPHDMIV